MSTHLALYRKWRPQKFEDVVGQDHIIKTITNAIKTNRLAHAYVFSGPRGTGKTTTARLIAKALNCEQGPTTSPCNQCNNCIEIQKGVSLDVIEIDAASNRGIDEIRTLREQVKFAASKNKFKVYIIDEFHMLTNEASNAFLKTLEEPPSGVIFILATTEPHKILPTILSRCQRFDFKKITTQALLNKLNQVIVSEKIFISDKALLAIARHSQGGLRDALSILDQVSAFASEGEQISDELVYQILGFLKEDILFEIGQNIANNSPNRVIELVNQLLDRGIDAFTILKEITNLFRNLLIVKNIDSNLEELNIFMDKEQLKLLSDKFSLNELFICIETLNQTAELLKRLPLSSLWLEVNLVKLCFRKDLIINEQLKQKIEELEKKLENLENKLNKQSINFKPNLDREIQVTNIKKEELPTIDNTLTVSNTDIESNKIEFWKNFLQLISTQNIPLGALLDKAKPGVIDRDKKIFNIHFVNSIWKEKLERNLKDIKLMESIFYKLTGLKFNIKINLGEPITPQEFNVPDLKINLEKESKLTEPKQERESFDIVKESVSVFKGKIIDSN